MTGQRLSATTLAHARAPLVPTYDRASAPTIAHLGVGAFARAHLGVYADDLLRAGYPALIRGVSLRSRGAEEQLGPQDGLYTVDEREPGEECPLRVVGSLASVATGPEAAIEAIAAPTTALVTLTVTEKGYGVAPGSAPSVIAHGLDRRRDHGPPPVIASLDNVQDNGGLLRRQVLAAAALLDDDLARWIADEVPFPSSVVDRMVPATTAIDRDAIAGRLGVRDDAAVIAEHHRSWFITEVDGLPPLADVGVGVVGDIGPYQRRKLWLLNGPHSALAYGGLLAGVETIADAAVHPIVSGFVGRLVDDVLEVADLPAASDPRAFADESLRRFANPQLGHTCRQVGADGSQKLPQRILPVVAARRRDGLGTERCAVVVAVWLAAVTGLPLHGTTLPTVDDPAAADLQRAAQGRDLRGLSQAAVGEHADRTFAAEVAGTLEALMRDGIDGLREDP